MGKKWKRLLVQRRAQPKAAPVAKPVVSNSEIIERMEAATPAPATEPEVIEEAPSQSLRHRSQSAVVLLVVKRPQVSLDNVSVA
jgi:hypothetical protein